MKDHPIQDRIRSVCPTVTRANHFSSTHFIITCGIDCIVASMTIQRQSMIENTHSKERRIYG